MGLFTKKKKEPTDYEKTVKLAKEILNRIGTKKKVYSCNLAPGGGYYNEVVYEGYGLKIVSSDYMSFKYGEQLKIKFNGSTVLDSNTFIRGSWEELLKELHNRVSVIEDNMRKEEEHQKNAFRILFMLSSLGEKDSKNISDSIEVNVINEYGGYDNEHYYGTCYYIYKNGEKVFHGFHGSARESKVYTYIPGYWEYELSDYLDNKYLKDEQLAREKSEKAFEENIKKLRYLR